MGLATVLENIEIVDWTGPFSSEVSARSVAALEEGKILFAPQLRFALKNAEKRFLSPDLLDGKRKNLSLDPRTGNMRGTGKGGPDLEGLAQMLSRFSNQALALIQGLCPGYRDHLTLGLASFRPAEIAGRTSSWRKDDTRLHVDAFPSRPVQGRRILRLFANVNPNAARVWRAGEPFDQVAETFLPTIRPPMPAASWVLQHIRIVKGRRTPYDHFMLGIHDRMKADDGYQNRASKTEIAFPPGSTWACFTDAVSHAAMSGQFAFEQTFYLPVAAMQDPFRSPLRVMERRLGRTLE